MARHSCAAIVMAVLMLCCSFASLEKVACIRLHYPGRAAAAHSYRPVGDTMAEAARWKHSIGTWSQRSGMQQLMNGAAVDACSPCDEVYVVRDDGETLQTISEKCHAPFILLDNPHVQDTDDISAGSVLLISSTHLPCSHL